MTFDHRRQERESWGEGPWVNEPDKIQWQDEATGLPCLVVRGPLGAWCGYVGVAEGHPFFEVDYAEIDDVSAHGELTFSNFCAPDEKEHGICHIVESGENDRVWWLGFDCGHYMDLVPRLVRSMRSVGIDLQDRRERFGETYKTVDYVRAATTDLAKQLAEVA